MYVVVQTHAFSSLCTTKASQAVQTVLAETADSPFSASLAMSAATMSNKK